MASLLLIIRHASPATVGPSFTLGVLGCDATLAVLRGAQSVVALTAFMLHIAMLAAKETRCAAPALCALGSREKYKLLTGLDLSTFPQLDTVSFPGLHTRFEI